MTRIEAIYVNLADQVFDHGDELRIVRRRRGARADGERLGGPHLAQRSPEARRAGARRADFPAGPRIGLHSEPGA